MARYSRKDYEMVAGTMQAAYKAGSMYPFAEVIAQFAVTFANDNPNFKLDKFLLACCHDYTQHGLVTTLVDTMKRASDHPR